MTVIIAVIALATVVTVASAKRKKINRSVAGTVTAMTGVELTGTATDTTSTVSGVAGSPTETRQQVQEQKQ